MTVDPIQSGALAFEAVNSSGERVMFDSWTISKGYTFREFSATIREDAWDAAHGRPGHGFPSDKEVTYQPQPLRIHDRHGNDGQVS